MSDPAALPAQLPKEGQFGRHGSWITHNLLYVYLELEDKVRELVREKVRERVREVVVPPPPNWEL